MPLSDSEISKIEEEREGYTKKKRVYDGIVSLIQDSELSPHYEYGDNEISVSVDPEFRSEIERESFSPDLCFRGKNKKAILFVEETFNPENKLEQLRSYICFDVEQIKTLLGITSYPDVDVFLIVPRSKRTKAVDVFNQLLEDEFVKKKIGGRCGLCVWYYDERMTKMTLNASKPKSDFISNFCKTNPEVVVIDENKIPIYKNAPPIEMLLFILSKTAENLGDEEYHIDKNKIEDMFTPWGLTDEKKFKNALQLGERIGVLENVVIEQMYAEPKYKKDHQSSIIHLSHMMADPINFMRGQIPEEDKNQTSLTDWQNFED